jgi:hypothetical protein
LIDNIGYFLGCGAPFVKRLRLPLSGINPDAYRFHKHKMTFIGLGK